MRTLSCGEHYRAMAFAQLTYRESLRDIETCLSVQVSKLYSMGFRDPVRRSTLADANEARDWRIYAEFQQETKWSWENMMDEMAEVVGLDPVQFRMMHITKVTPAETRHPYQSFASVEVLEEGAKAFGWDKRNPVAGGSPGRFKRGLGLGMCVLASVAARGHKTGWPGYDRACTQALPGRFHLPARALGYKPVMDYRADQLGIQANTGGALLVEGTWYCPALPGPLITATARLRDHAIGRDLYDQQIAARCPYQLTHKDGPDTDGYQRLSCPATGSHPGLMCPLRQASLTPRDGRAKVLQPPQEPPRLCTQTAITIAPGTGARYRQDLPYGTPAWHKSYATLRNTIEGLNGYIKDPAHQALAQPARRRVRGIAAQSLFTALLLMAANIRKIRAWRALTASGKARTTRRARRRQASLRDYLPDG